jgi:hypothetical protein
MRITMRVAHCLRNQVTTTVERGPGKTTRLKYLGCNGCEEGRLAKGGHLDDADVERLIQERMTGEEKMNVNETARHLVDEAINETGVALNESQKEAVTDIVSGYMAERKPDDGPEPTKACTDCGDRRGSLPLDKFPKHAKTKDGRGKICHDCLSKRARARHERKRRIEKGPAAQAEQSNGRKAKGGERGGEPSPAKEIPGSPAPLSIDFKDYPDLLESIKAFASHELRTPENQVLYWLRDMVVPLVGAKEREAAPVLRTQ